MPFTEDLSPFFNTGEHATEVIYTSVSGSVISTDIILVTGVSRIGFDSEMSITHNEATFKNSDVPDPTRDDTFNDGSKTYTLISEIVNDGKTSIWLVKSG